MRRPAAFAGSWYPGAARDLEAMLAGFTPATKAEPALALMAPHAGYRYSGAIAAETYARVRVPATAVVLCPNHRVPPPVLSVWAKGSWETPLGEIPIDEALAKKILDHGNGFFDSSPSPHKKEHAVELQLPLLQRANPDVRIVPIVVAVQDLERAGKVLARAIQEHDRETLIVASSDMNHFESAEIARVKDERALERVLALDPVGLVRTVDEHDVSMCGVRPTAMALHAVHALGGGSAQLVRYGNSGDISGDNESVVGYAGVVIRARQTGRP